MTISERIRKIREYRGLKQATVANEMHITQQAYSWLERKSGNIKVETLKKFCEAIKVDLPFLVATEIAITDENMKTFDALNYSLVFEEYLKISKKMNIYEDILLRKNASHSPALHESEIK